MKIANNFLLLSIVIFLCFGSFLSLTANTETPAQTGISSQIEISNSFVIITYSSTTKSLEVTARPEMKVVLRNLLPEKVTGVVSKQKSKSPEWGEGNSLVFSTVDGGNISFTLYNGFPFLVVDQIVKNNGTSITDIQKLNPFSFIVDLGKPADQLMTLGTGGLLKPDKNPGSYLFLTTVNPTTRNGVVAGWLTNNKGSGVLFSEITSGFVKIKPQIDYGRFRLPAGKSEATETLLIGYFDDARLGEEQFADALAKAHHIKMRERSAVYCTWYSEKNGGAGNEAGTIELAHYIKNNLKPFGLGVIQIDDQWQDGGNYNGPRRAFDRVNPKGGYPNGMVTTTSTIKKAGLSAGIWWMPFSRNYQDPEYKYRQHWFARRTNGEPYETTWGGTSLDLTQPEVLQHVANVSRTLQNWGFDYFKMDGLWTGTVTEQVYINDGYKNDSIGNCQPLFNPMVTQIEAYRNGLKLIRKTTKNKVFLSGCCISQNMRSFGSAIGLVDAMRIGPDFNHDGENIRTGVIRASRLYFLNGRVWWNDPDPSMLRESGKATADGASQGIGSVTRAKLLPSFVALSGQFFLSSDWLPELPAARVEIMKRTMASHTGIARPVDAFDKTLPSIWLATDQKTGTTRNVIGLFNWNTTSQTLGCSLKWAGLNENMQYHAFDFWANHPLPDIENSISSDLPAESCQLIAIRAKLNHPVVVSTSQHVTQGMIDLLAEKWENNTLSGTSKLIGEDYYEMRIAGINDGAPRKLEEALVIENSGEAKIKILQTSDSGWIRVAIYSEKDQLVKWQLKFKTDSQNNNVLK